MITVRHKSDSLRARGVSHDGFLFLTNTSGDYLSFPEIEASRYHGWVIRDEGTLYKIIDSISIAEFAPTHEIEYLEDQVVRRTKKAGREHITLGNEHSWSLSYDSPVTLEIALDVRPLLELPEWGREHTLRAIKGEGLIEASLPRVRFFIACISDSGPFTILGRWQFKTYLFDQNRNSPPFHRYVYTPFSVRGKRFAFGVGRNPQTAFSMARALFKREGEETISPKHIPFSFPSRTPEEVEVAGRRALHSLSSLSLLSEGEWIPRAGLPWFSDIWARDALISLGAFPESYRLHILKRFWEGIREKGFMTTHPGTDQVSADALGWFFFRLSELKSGALDMFGKDFFAVLRRIVEDHREHKSEGGLASNGPYETWMDTLSREGARIELQALRLAMYRFAFRATGDPRYRRWEEELVRLTRGCFWANDYLKDAPLDRTIRPNIFLAAYVYPFLLTPDLWEKCFRTALKALFLSWGGLASINVRDEKFHPDSTGQNPESYHNGDSWFYLNNIAAIVMNRISGKVFRAEIKKILEASTREILFSGALGHHGEISHARTLKSAGAWAQAWSNATYLEMISELFRRSSPVSF